ncbi:HDOD domain-containing protein [Thiomicrorhabdus sediminis]|uniref:HDOD domain-containing protein n=1 Tax=Thiomicrorhabdus sediminis TaxID=2580412 RepID=A0A4P9K4Q5_9GAMM|nr:HDOD domain-containing protein [Thiomicrorhabdus sediminis]QCU89187.1 HDOD domain-containing protein [Thiomicrorhabdus sediminis]
MQEAIKRAVAVINSVKLPEMPKEIADLDQELSHPLSNSRNVAKIIEQNTTLTGDVLRIIKERGLNKSGQPLNSIYDAVNLVGLTTIRNVILTAAFERAKGRGSLFANIIEQNIDTAFCMAELADHVHGITPNEAFMLGLMHNAGALVLAEKDASRYEKLHNHSLVYPTGIIDKEERVFNTNHAMIGAVLGRMWGLSSEMMSAIRFHHMADCSSIADEKIRSMVAMLRIAWSIVAEITGDSFRSEDMKNFELNGLEELLIDSDHIQTIRRALIIRT